MQRAWSLSFVINPFGTVGGYSSILHATVGNNKNNYGDRTPGIWFNPGTTSLLICSAVNGNKNYCITTTPLLLYKNSSIKVRQIVNERQNRYFYYYQIYINGKAILNIQNKKPKVFKKVKYYASDPWYTPAKATISDFKLTMFPIPIRIGKIDI